MKLGLPNVLLAVLTAVSVFNATVASAGGVPVRLANLVVTASNSNSPYVESESASEGVVTQEQLAQRPVSRTAELLEFVPGLIATQHSGEGKANQYFVRGFNLDHGTDFAISVDGLPVNLRSHGHGQGYADLNFLIPELVASLAYRKGPYYAEVGDFSAAGSADFSYASTLTQPFVKTTAGENGFYRAVAAGSTEAAHGDLLLAAEYNQFDGPFVQHQDINKLNAVAKYSRVTTGGDFSVSAMAYDNSWNAVDQIPLRAVNSGLIDRLGFIDPTVGGDSHRYSLSFNARGALAIRDDASDFDRWRLSGYFIDYRLDLFSNFTYFLNDPINGDQFEQFDKRQVYGLSGDYHLGRDLFGGDLSFGFEARYDDIGAVGLYKTRQRQRLSTVREDAVDETSVGLYLRHKRRWNSWLRSAAAVRADYFNFAANSRIADSSGQRDDVLISPKLSLIAELDHHSELFLNLGRGFHSNDARGVVLAQDPSAPDPGAQRADPLVSAWASDLGLRLQPLPSLQATLSLWYLHLDSELVFVGDAGNTEAQGASERYGTELSLLYRPLPGLIIDADYAYSHARFTHGDVIGNRIPNAVVHVASVGLSYNQGGRFGAGLRLRHLGSAPLVEDNSQRSPVTTLLNGQLSYQLNEHFALTLAGFNLLNSTDNDITYFYESQLQAEDQAVADEHFHPVEPRNFRLSLRFDF